MQLESVINSKKRVSLLLVSLLALVPSSLIFSMGTTGNTLSNPLETLDSGRRQTLIVNALSPDGIDCRTFINLDKFVEDTENCTSDALIEITVYFQKIIERAYLEGKRIYFMSPMGQYVETKSNIDLPIPECSFYSTLAHYTH